MFMRLKQLNRPKEKQIEITGEIKISEEKPPIYKSVCKFLGYSDIQAFFTYGDTLYNPAKLPIPNDIIVHERVHMKRQSKGEMTPELWWGKWLRDEKFRINEESIAYGAQFRALKTIYKDRNQQNQILINLAKSLSGTLYGNTIGQVEAMLLIKSYAQ